MLAKDILSFINSDKENLYSFLAFQILLDNKDTDTQNYYLYSPVGTDKFYLLPWDMDGALRSDYELLRDPDYDAGWERGIFLFTESQLFRRIMQSEACTNELSAGIARLHEGLLSGEQVEARARQLAAQVRPFLYAYPDLGYARVTETSYDQLLTALPEQLDENYYAYYDSLETPWPFHILTPTSKGGTIEIHWEETQVLDGTVRYELEVSDTWRFDHTAFRQQDLDGSSCNIGALSAGMYFVRVTAVSDHGTRQEAYEIYNTEQNTTVHGVLCFFVREDGSVSTSLF